MLANEFVDIYCDKKMLNEMSKTAINPSGEYNEIWMKQKKEPQFNKV